MRRADLNQQVDAFAFPSLCLVDVKCSHVIDAKHLRRRLRSCNLVVLVFSAAEKQICFDTGHLALIRRQSATRVAGELIQNLPAQITRPT